MNLFKNATQRTFTNQLHILLLSCCGLNINIVLSQLEVNGFVIPKRAIVVAITALVFVPASILVIGYRRCGLINSYSCTTLRMMILVVLIHFNDTKGMCFHSIAMSELPSLIRRDLRLLLKGSRPLLLKIRLNYTVITIVLV